MSEDTALIYLETDDEVTSVARRLRDANSERVVLVAPGRSRATSSVVALRLLARIAEESGRGLSVVGDALTRSLAVEAGLDAYASVDDARHAVPAPAEAEARRASIHVVRGDASEGTETIALAGTSTATRAEVDTETRPVPVVRPQPAARAQRDRPSRRPIPLAVLLGGIAALVIGAGVLGAAVLPAATVTVVPASEPLGPVAYEIRIDDPVRRHGTVEATAPVRATGTYPIQVAATGVAVFRNFNSFDVAVDAGTLVAAGEQAFETTENIVVPAGTLTAEGTILASEEAAGVVASAVGPAANVAADAIDTILSQNVAASLRGFGNNNERLVLNPEPTAGGVDDTGTEITQQDVDDARAALLAALDVAVADALGATGAAVHADPAESSEPVIEGLDGLVGTRDPESAEISGTLAYDRLAAESDEVLARATERLAGDTTVLPAGHEIVPSATEVSIGEARQDGDALFVAVSVTGASTPTIDRDVVIERVRGRSADEAAAALTELGDATIDLWPDWVSSVPGIDWRIDVRIAGERGATPVPSSRASGAP
ncbi:MAG: hypothetical protein QOI85_186 [Chloroflexota bacterium]|nr:hypothetical protein [Chloroflexota bacterium]